MKMPAFQKCSVRQKQDTDHNNRHRPLEPGQLPYIHVPGPGDFIGIPPGEEEEITQSFLVFEWTSLATCTPGCSTGWNSSY